MTEIYVKERTLYINVFDQKWGIKFCTKKYHDRFSNNNLCASPDILQKRLSIEHEPS